MDLELGSPSTRKINCLNLEPNFFENGSSSATPSHDSTLYLHPSTMTALSFVDDCCALVCTSKGSLVVKLCSSDAVKAQCAVFHSSVYKYYESSIISIYSLNLSIDAAKEIYLYPDNYRNFMSSPAFQTHVTQTIRHIYIKKDLTININYMGYSCNFTVKQIIPHTDGVILTEESVSNNNEHPCNETHHSEIIDEIDAGFDAIQTSTPISSRKDPARSLRGRKKHHCEERFYFLHSLSKVIIKQCEPETCISFRDIIALDEVILYIKISLSSILQSDCVSSNIFPKGILLIGPSGSGKSMIGKALKTECKIPVFIVECQNIKSLENTGGTELERIFKEAISCPASIIYFDNLDVIFTTDNPLFKEKELLGNIKSLIFKALNYVPNALVIATAKNVNLIPSYFRKNEFFAKELQLNISALGRKKIFLKILEKHKCILSETEINKIIEDTNSLSGGQLQHLCDKAKELFMQDFQSNAQNYPFRFQDLTMSLKQIKPAVPFNFEIPNVKWSDIGGMREVKEALQEMISWPLRLSNQFKQFRITPSRGILMYGPPGCCKTMVAKALVTEGNFNFIPVKASELFNKYVGESEKTVSDLFKRARTSAPCVLFFDEIDSLTSTRNSTSGSSNVTERILTQLLTEIDGIEPLTGVSILAATNRPDIIDPSFLRPGRFDHMIYVPLPDAETRFEIFNVKLRKMPSSEDVNDVSYLVNSTEGYSGAEISEICQMAARCAIREDAVSVSMKHFTKALVEVLPKTSADMKQLFENYKIQRTSQS